MRNYPLPMASTEHPPPPIEEYKTGQNETFPVGYSVANLYDPADPDGFSGEEVLPPEELIENLFNEMFIGWVIREPENLDQFNQQSGLILLQPSQYRPHRTDH
jgi:hypothetical protein